MNIDVFVDVISSIVCKTLSIYLKYQISAEDLEVIPSYDERSIAAEIRYLGEFLAEEFDYLESKQK